MTPSTTATSPREETTQALSRIIGELQDLRSELVDTPPDSRESCQPEILDDDVSRAEILHWKKVVEAIRDLASERPEISERRNKDAWHGTSLLQSSILSEISRLCGEHLRSTTVGPRPLGTTTARGPKTDAVAERDGFHVKLKWTRKGNEYYARIFEPTMMDITPALADVLALSVEEPLRFNAEYGL
ncbi:hypothetical protein G6L37_00340 [Agrobacterium rubi]|nr:hypothetical protein [Agrobacterium rubi]NTF23837.1 hypothetical protein [Agrobacterium rubi]